MPGLSQRWGRWMRWLQLIAVTALLVTAGPARAQAGNTALYVATERLTDLVLGHPQALQVARLGFGTPQQPWHTWFGGSPELQNIVHLPGYRPGAPVKLEASAIIGQRFGGKVWSDAFAALASFDRDGDGIVEGAELKDLWIWIDFQGDGRIADRSDSLRPVSFYYGGFDLRPAARVRSGHARQGRIRAFSVMVPYGNRIHLLELDVSTTHASRLAGLLSTRPAVAFGPGEAAHPLQGRWRWALSNEAQWTDTTRPWGPEAGGLLLLSVSQGRVQGVVQTLGPHEDRINLPLQGSFSEGRGQWTSVSPLGLSRSEVRLESLYGQPVLRGRTWSNRNGKLSEWTWEARHDGPLE
ncbi:MAG: hypothetical protein JNJ71_02220 [Rubrivivax sp.]|nr:hypothetical protein [Rubrivivax sp.]